MNKTILIGFFLAFTTGYGMTSGVSNGEAYWRKELHITSLLFSPLALGDPLPRQAGEEERRIDVPDDADDYGKWWIALAVFLLILPIYLLFLLRKGQAMARQIAVLQEDIMTLFNHSPCGYHAIDENGVIVQVNNTLLEWLGYQKTEIVGKLRVAEIVEVTKGMAAAQSADSAVGKTYLNLIKKNGETIPVILHQITAAGSERASKRRLFCTIDNTDCAEALKRIASLDQELESFSYSISHDLRAPLRSIDGYSRILLEDYAPQLGDEGRRVLSVITNNAKRMGKLIDDLLEFGRLGRKTVQRSHVNMTAMASTIADDLIAGAPGRKINVKVGTLDAAFADVDMMRQVWSNLLDNAFKYTGKKTEATIEISSVKTRAGEIRYEVKDNGIGFDMRYAHKLFGVFQRLHKIQDFPGTGVGLAIVKRIISRHGGRVWAKASLESGAIFYFTIPTDDENK